MRYGAFFLLTAALLVSNAQGRTWHVPTDASTIGAGIDSAAVGDTVLVACGTYHESGLTMSRPIALRGETGQPDCVIIDGLAAATLLTCDFAGSVARIEGITFTGGWGETSGAILVLGSAELAITDCIFKENYAGIMPGGGRGGGVGCFDQSRVWLTRCRLTENGAYGGGGVYCEGAGEVGLDHCVLENNGSTWGGGLELRDAVTCTVSSCTFYGNNSYSWQGGGITNWSSITANVTSTIIAFGQEGSAVEGFFSLTACDLYGNAEGDWIGVIADQLGVSGNICADPLFCNPEIGDLTIRSDSPCAPENNPEYGLIGALPVGCEPSVSVNDQTSRPHKPQLDHCWPNPFNPATRIGFSLPWPGLVRLEVFTVSGRQVITLIEGRLSAGHHEIRWSGCDAAGRCLPSGVYVYRLSAGDHVESRSMLLLR
jgi:hypothetical protein